MTSPLTALNLAVVHSFSFKGRATRSEFWWFSLFVLLGTFITATIDFLMMRQLFETGDLAAVEALNPFDFTTIYYVILTTLPMTTLSVRRLHDVGMSGFWWFIGLVPLIGGIILFILYCLPSSGATSVHGTPKNAAPRNTAPGNVASRAATGKPVPLDTHKRAMQGYAILFDKDKPVTQEIQAARKAEISDYYRSRVLKSAPSS